MTWFQTSFGTAVASVGGKNITLFENKNKWKLVTTGVHNTACSSKIQSFRLKIVAKILHFRNRAISLPGARVQIIGETSSGRVKGGYVRVPYAPLGAKRPK